MPRGEETQEVPQEGREKSKEVQESKPEAQRDAEVVAQPEAVIERERPVEESEAIEAELKAAVESVPETTSLEIAEVGDTISVLPVPVPGQPDRPENEISATPINTPGPTDEISLIPENDGVSEKPEEQQLVESPPAPEWDEDPPRPPQGRSEGGGSGTEDGDVAVSLDETSFKVESQAEFEEAILDETSFKVESPVSEQEIREDPEAEVEEVILDDTSFKFFTPLPHQDLIEGIEGESVRGEVVGEEETGEILEAESFKPVPAREGAEQIEHEDHWSAPVSEVGIEGEEPAEGTTEEGEESQEEEGGSILIGEEGELEQIDLTAEATKEVEEYWEPPEIYIHQHKDGSVEFVDANGNPVKCPPHYSKDHETGEVQAWYPGAEEKAFKIPSYQGLNPEDISTFTDKDGNVYFYDKNNNPLHIPPEFMKDTDGSIMVKDAGGKYVTINTVDIPELFAPGSVMVYEYPDGSYDLITADGIPSEWIPDVYRDSEGNYYTKDLQGKEVAVGKVEPTGTLYTSYIYQNSDGSYSIVDSQGKQVIHPPHVDKIVDNDGTVKYIGKTKDGEVVEIEIYQPLPDGLFAYTSQDGSVYLVDKDGNQVESPPHLDIEQSPTGTKFYTPDGSPSGVEILHYQPPIKDMFVHLNQDGSIDIVDKNGNMIESPPNITFDYDPTGKPIYHAKYAGMPLESSVQLKYYKPPSSHWDNK